MLTIHANKIDISLSKQHNLKCMLVEQAAMIAAELNNNASGCTFLPEYTVSIQPHEDMLIPIFICPLHFNSLKLGLSEGIGLDQSLLTL